MQREKTSSRPGSPRFGALSIVFAAGFLVAVVASTFVLWVRSETDTRSLTAALLIESRLAALQLVLRDAGSSARSYLLAAQPADLDKWRHASAAIMPALADAKAAAVDSERSRERLAALEPDIALALEELRDTIGRFDAGERAGALEVARSALGPDRLGAFVAALDQIARDELQAVASRMAESGRVSFWLLAVRRAGLAVLVGVVIVSTFLIRKTDRERDAALRLLETANAELETKVSERTAEFRRTMEVLDNTISSMAAAVLVTDRCGIVLSNRAADQLFGTLTGKDPKEWTKNYAVYLPDETTPLPSEQWSVTRALQGEAVDNMEVYLRRLDSAKGYHLVASSRPLRDGHGAITGAVMVYHDITEKRQIERQLRQAQRMEAVGQLTGGVAHDFNNILTVITGTIDILARAVAHEPILASITRMIDEAANRGAELTRRLLAFARKQPLQPRPTDINTLVAESAKLLRPTLGEQVEIETLLEGDTWPALVDPSQLATALVNLALNARDAMARGGKMTLQTGNVFLDQAYAQRNVGVRAGPYVLIAVHDTGTGIPAAIRDKVFEPFFTTKETGKGTGLGLSMVYGFVKQSGGHIKVDSAEDHGTTISLYLPRADDAVDMRDASVPIIPLEGGHETILVVEDDPLVRAFVIAQLESLGYHALAAENAHAALAIIDRGARIDLLFTDVVMPGGMNGRQLADEATRRRSSIKVLFTSGYSEDVIVHHGRLDTGVRLLAKPYRKVDLARMIRLALEAKDTAAPVEAA